MISLGRLIEALSYLLIELRISQWAAAELAPTPSWPTSSRCKATTAPSIDWSSSRQHAAALASVDARAAASAQLSSKRRCRHINLQTSRTVEFSRVGLPVMSKWNWVDGDVIIDKDVSCRLRWLYYGMIAWLYYSICFLQWSVKYDTEQSPAGSIQAQSPQWGLAQSSPHRRRKICWKSAWMSQIPYCSAKKISAWQFRKGMSPFPTPLA